MRTIRGPITMVKVVLKPDREQPARPQDVRDGQRPRHRPASGACRRGRAGRLRHRAARPRRRGRSRRRRHASLRDGAGGDRPRPSRRHPRQRRLREEPRAARAATSRSRPAPSGRPARRPTPAAGHVAGMAVGADTAPDGRRLVGSDHPAPPRPVVRAGRAQPARLDHRQRRRAAVHERGAAVRRGHPRDLRRRGDRRRRTCRPGWSSTSATATATSSRASRRASRSRAAGTRTAP